MQHNLSRHSNNRKTQGGATLLGMLFIGAMIVFVALVGMKMVPAYIEFFSVKKVIKSMKQEPLGEMDKKAIRDSFDRRASTSYIEVVKGSDLTIEKGAEGGAVVSVEYRVIKPIMGNVSVMLDFSTSSDQ